MGKSFNKYGFFTDGTFAFTSGHPVLDALFAEHVTQITIENDDLIILLKFGEAEKAC